MKLKKKKIAAFFMALILCAGIFSGGLNTYAGEESGSAPVCTEHVWDENGTCTVCGAINTQMAEETVELQEVEVQSEAKQSAEESSAVLAEDDAQVQSETPKASVAEINEEHAETGNTDEAVSSSDTAKAADDPKQEQTTEKEEPLTTEKEEPLTAEKPAVETDGDKDENTRNKTGKEDGDKDTDPSEDPDASDQDTDEENEDDEKEDEAPAFSQSVTVNGIVVTVEAGKGVFPKDAVLTVAAAPEAEKEKADAAVDSKRAEGTNVAVSYTLDIKVLDTNGKEIQPENEEVQVSFRLAEVSNENLDTQVYHLEEQGEELSARLLDVKTEGETATVSTDGFSYYTVEFTYGDKQYVLDGSSADLSLADVLEKIGLTGEISAAKVSNPSLVYVGEDPADGWRLVPLAPFDSEEQLKVILDGIEYEILLTDDYVSGGTTATSGTFASGAPIATITIDHSKLMGNIGTDIFLENVAPNYQRISGISWSGTDIVANDVLFQNAPSANSAASSRVGSFDLRYKDAAVLSDGDRRDLVITFEVTVMPRIDYSLQEWRNINLFSTNLGNTPTFSPCFLTYTQSRGGVRYDVSYKIVDSSKNPVNGTYIYTAYGFNLNNWSTDNQVSNNHNKVLYCDANYEWAESINIQAGAQSDMFIPSNLVSSYSGSTLYANANSRGNANDRSYVSGEVVAVDAQTLKTRVQSYFAWGGPRTNCYLLPDGVTHNYTSSSGYYGKIELWSSGAIGTGDLLYGGRYVNGQVDEKRTYDVTYGKDVTYKLTPEAGYILDGLYIDGQAVSLDDPNLDVVLKGDGTVDYYTYRFAGDTAPGDLQTPNFDPRSEKGGSAHTIHVTWQPTVEIELEKVWDDQDDLLKMRPLAVDVTLAPWPTIVVKGGNLVYPIHKNALTRNDAAYTLTAADNWKHTYINLPKYEAGTYNEVSDSGTLIQYSITENMAGDAAQYYTEIHPHVIKKTDTAKHVVYLADGTDSNHLGFDETNTTYATTQYGNRTMDYKIINRLYTGGLVIEKDIVPDKAQETFTFTVTLTHPHADFSVLGYTGSAGGEWTKTLTLSGDSLSTLLSGLPKGTAYTVTETLPDKWRMLTSDGTSGTILDGDLYAYDIGGTLYIRDGAGYIDTTGASVTLPVDSAPLLAPYYGTGLGNASGSYRFDKIGAEIVAGAGGADAYRYGDRKTVPAEALNAGSAYWSVAYASQSQANGQYVVYASDNTKADDTVIGTAVDRAYFQNIKTADLTVSKTVTGNQASKDKYFKFTVQLTIDPAVYSSNMDYKDAVTGLASGAAGILNAWVSTLDVRGADIAPSGNQATVYAASAMSDNTANGRDDDAAEPGRQIRFSGGSATVTFYLQSGQQFTLEDLPYGTDYTVTEEEEDYRPSLSITGDDKTNDATGAGTQITAGQDVDTAADTYLKQDTTLAFSNIRGGIVPTEVRSNTSLPVFMVAAAMLGLAILFISRRKVRAKH